MMRILPAKHKVNLSIVVFFVVLVLIAVIYGNYLSERKARHFGDLPEIQQRGVLRALTLYSSTSYFIYRDKKMGYEYELCARLAKSLDLELKMVVAPNIRAMQDSLDAGVGDIIAYNVPINSRIKDDYLFCGREFLTHQVLVQKKSHPDLVRDVTQLVGKEILVQKGSRYYTRLMNLNDELGGGILIRALEDDSLTIEEMIGQVATGSIKYTIADNVLAQLNKTYYKNLDIATSVSFPQHSFWVVRKDAPLLASAVDDWFRNNVRSNEYKTINKRYFELSKGPSPFLTTGRSVGKDGRLSPYDDIFKKYGSAYGYDWRLLASIAYQESKFDPDVVSWAGAVGLMQLMPRTAGDFDVATDSLTDPDTNVLAAMRLIKSLERSLRGVSDKEQRLKLVLAGFNSGLGHILDARALARKYEKDPDKWDNDNVGHFIQLKSQPKYYDDPVCKQGYLRGSETANFVTEVWTRYQYYVSKGVK